MQDSITVRTDRIPTHIDEYTTPLGMFDTWDHAKERVESADMSPKLVITYKATPRKVSGVIKDIEALCLLVVPPETGDIHVTDWAAWGRKYSADDDLFNSEDWPISGDSRIAVYWNEKSCEPGYYIHIDSDGKSLVSILLDSAKSAAEIAGLLTASFACWNRTDLLEEAI